MAKAKLTEQEKLQQEKVEERVSAVEKFFDENKKTIWSVLGGIVVIGLVVLCWQKFYLTPKKAEAAEQLYPAEALYRAGDYEGALLGDGNVLGFEQIISEYGKKAGKAVYMYAGVSSLLLENYDNAIYYLKKYNGKDPILAARSLSCLGDAYCGLEDYTNALSCYKKAAAQADNMYAASYLLKAGIVSETLGNPQEALAFYKKIKDQYPSSVEGYDIDKYISRIENAPEE